MLSNLQTEIEVTQKKRSQLKAEVDADTERQLEERTKALKEAEQPMIDRLLALDKKQVVIEAHIKEHSHRRDEIKTEITSFLAELEQHRKTLGGVKQEIEQSRGELEALRAKQTGVSEGLTTLREQLANAQTKHSGLTGEVAALESKKATLESDFEKLHSDYVTIREQTDYDIKVLTDKKLKLKADIADEERTWQRVREDLAKRQLAMDERDKNLKRREYKLERDEKMVQNNAGLLNL